MKAKNKVFIGILGILIFTLGIFFLFFNTYTISGKIIDLASKEAVKDVKVNIGNVVTTTDKDGFFQLKNIKKYQSGILEIKVPAGYEELTPISPKEYLQNIALSPTLETMVDRINNASRNGQHDYLYDYMHPDDQVYWESKENYSTTFKKLYEIAVKQGESSPIFGIGKNIRKLDTWIHGITGKKYADVMEVPVENKINENNGKINLNYFQKIDGVWRYFTGANKEEAKKFIDQFAGSKELLNIDSMDEARVIVRDSKRQSDMRQLVAAQSLYSADNNRYYTCGLRTGDCEGMVRNMPKAIGKIIDIPVDPINKGSVCGDDYIYCALDNTTDSDKFCYYAKIEGGGFYTASHNGVFKKNVAPKNFAECSSE